jgi:hypothetical protein
MARKQSVHLAPARNNEKKGAEGPLFNDAIPSVPKG